jgi:hypothetical protein
VCLHPAHKNLHQFGSILCWCSPRMGIWNRVHEIQSLKINVSIYIRRSEASFVPFTLHQAAVHTKKEKKNSKENILLVKLWKNLRNKPRMVMEFTNKLLKYLIYISEVSKYQLDFIQNLGNWDGGYSKDHFCDHKKVFF